PRPARQRSRRVDDEPAPTDLRATQHGRSRESRAAPGDAPATASGNVHGAVAGAKTPGALSCVWAWYGESSPRAVAMKPVVALNADQLLKRACNVIDRRSLDRCTCSSRIQILLELSVEVLVRPDVEDFDEVALPVELVRRQELERLDFELDDPHTLERSDLGLADERVGDDALDDLVHLELGRRREPPLRLPEAGCL